MLLRNANGQGQIKAQKPKNFSKLSYTDIQEAYTQPLAPKIHQYTVTKHKLTNTKHKYTPTHKLHKYANKLHRMTNKYTKMQLRNTILQISYKKLQNPLLGFPDPQMTQN